VTSIEREGIKGRGGASKGGGRRIIRRRTENLCRQPGFSNFPRELQWRGKCSRLGKYKNDGDGEAPKRKLFQFVDALIEVPDTRELVQEATLERDSNCPKGLLLFFAQLSV